MSNWDIDALFSNTNYKAIDDGGPIQSILYEGEVYQGKATEVFAYLGVPETDPKPVPGIVCVHGGGGKAFRQWVELWMARGYAAIAMDLGGRDGNGTRLANAGPDQDNTAKFNTKVVWQDMWTYHAVAAVIRANSILRGLPSVDATRIGITGISWGGYLTCIAAGVDPRFACAMPVYGCGFLQHGSADDWMTIFAGMSAAERECWCSRCDPSMYMSDIAMPMLFVTGTNDFAYPLDIFEKSCALPSGSVTRCVRIEMPHDHEPGWAPKEIHIFADQHLAKGTPLPVIDACHHAPGLLKATVTSPFPVRSAYLAYTTFRIRQQDRKWHTASASLRDGMLEAILPNNVSACFLAVEDERGACVSSPYLEIP